MEPFNKVAQELLDEMTATLSMQDTTVYKSLVNHLLSAGNIAVAGMGRTNYVMGAFARRLAQLGRKVSVLGEAAYKRPGKGDVVVVGGLQGSRGPVTVFAESARDHGATVYAIVGEQSSILASVANYVIPLAQHTKTPFGSVGAGERSNLFTFDETAMLYLDVAVRGLQEVLGISPEVLAKEVKEL